MSKGMKLFIKLICLAVVLAFAGPFILKGPDGKPLISLDRIAPDLMDKFYGLKKLKREATQVLGETTGNENLGKTKVYRTTNENGTAQFSNIEPKQQGYEVIWVDPDTNLIQSDPVVEILPDKADAADKKDKPADDSFLPPILTVSPEQARQLMEDAKNLQKLADERAKALENL